MQDSLPVCRWYLEDGHAPNVIRVTEGVLKADVANVLDPRHIRTIGVPGVAQWASALPVLEALAPRRVWIAYDLDWQTNQHVARALEAAIDGIGAYYRVEVEL